MLVLAEMKKCARVAIFLHPILFFDYPSETHAFSIGRQKITFATGHQSIHSSDSTTKTTTLYSSPSQRQQKQRPGTYGNKMYRQRILSPPSDTLTRRDDGHHFRLDRFTGKIAFGYITDITTKLTETPTPSSISNWLSNAERVASAIWDEDLVDDLGQQRYRLKLMNIKFVTINMRPEVDILMWTEQEKINGKGEDIVFFIESVGFEPNLKLLPGVNLSSKSLGIKIDVAGELRVSSDGMGLTGKIGFVTSGNLPPPLRVLPSPTLTSAARIINRQIADFAVKSFQTGARREYNTFRLTEEN